MAIRPSALQRELRQRKPFTSKSHEGAVALLRTADVVRWRTSAALEEHDITPQQYNVLRVLRGAEPDGLPTLEIADRMVERTPGITRLLDRLEVKGLIGRTRGSADRRCVVCRISSPGLSLLSSLDAPVNEANEALFRGLSVTDVDLLLVLLESIRAGAG